MSAHDARVLAELRAIHTRLDHLFHELRHCCRRSRVSSLQVLFDGVAMPASLKPGQSTTATFNELAPDGVTVVTPPLPFDAPPSWSVDNSAVASVAAAADGLSANVAYVGPGTAAITVTGTINGNKVTGTDFVTDAPLPPAVGSLQLVFSTPTP